MIFKSKTKPSLASMNTKALFGQLDEQMLRSCDGVHEHRKHGGHLRKARPRFRPRFCPACKERTSAECVCSQLYQRTLLLVPGMKRRSCFFKKKPLVTVQTFSGGPAIWIQSDVRVSTSVARFRVRGGKERFDT